MLVNYRGQLLRVCKLAFTKKDASIYLFPYAPQKRFYSGDSAIPENVIEATFDYATGQLSETAPKLSIHQSGQVHVTAAGRRVAPRMTVPLAKLRGEHVATVTVDRFDGLLPFEGTPVTSGREPDLVIPVDDGAESGRLVLYVNGLAPQFSLRCPYVVTMRRESLSIPLYVGILPVGQPELGTGGTKPSIIVIAGWNPKQSRPNRRRIEYLYVRGE